MELLLNFYAKINLFLSVTHFGYTKVKPVTCQN